ncbi:tektin-1 [Penaeus vannamei]|uniref:tektin-1 n=1 Tax=Penaeus vannamei TaxID=6689 RepID=UPI00387FAF7E
MALLARDRRVASSEFTRDYYRSSSAPAALAARTPISREQPYAPAVPPRVPGQVGGDAWSPAPPINPAVWRASHSAKMHDARAQISRGERTREENRRACEETAQLTAGHQQEVERRLEDRLCDVTFWRDEVSTRYASLDEDAADLAALRDRLMKALHLYVRPLEVARRCIAFRKDRQGVEEVEDEASTALRQEVQELLRCRDALQRSLEDTQKQIRRVLSCRYHLEKNVQDKDGAIKVEEETRRLTATAHPTDIIHGQTIDPSPVSVDWWKATGVKLLERADHEHELSVQVLAVSEDILVAAGRHLKERLEHTDLCLATRVKDTRHAKTLLEEHHAKLVEEESQLEKSLVEVEDQLEAKRGPLALAQTRLHTRRRRPNMERTRDEVEAALLKEVEELELTISRLSSAAATTREQIQKIKSTRVSLQHDINLKAKTLLLDEVEVLGLRSSVKIDTH